MLRTVSEVMAPTRLVLLEKEKVSDTNAKVVEIVAERLSVGADTVKPESSFINDLGADSLDIVELVMEFEEAFDIQIPSQEKFIPVLLVIRPSAWVPVGLTAKT